MKQRFDVTGMSCTACSSHVERAVSALAGVSSVTVDLMQNRMLVDYDSTKLSEAEICAAVAAAGYGARPAGSSAAFGSASGCCWYSFISLWGICWDCRCPHSFRGIRTPCGSG